MLDLAVCPASMFHRLSARTPEDSFGSDHFPAFLLLGEITPFRYPPKRLKNYKIADWVGFRGSCSAAFEGGVEDFDSFLSCLVRCRDAAVPDVHVRPGVVRCRWWDADCSAALRCRERAMLKWRECRSVENFFGSKPTYCFVF